MYDYIIKNGYLFDIGKMDIAVFGQKIAKIAPVISDAALEVIDAEDKTVFPGFIDLHTHTDKAFTKEKVKNDSGTLLEAVENMTEFFSSVEEEDIFERSIRMVSMEILNGTCCIRSHISIDPVVGRKAWKVAQELESRFKDQISIQLVAFCQAVDKLEKGDAYYTVLEETLSSGADLLGGCPELSEDHKAFTDTMFALAEDYSVSLDLHVDESDEPDASALEYVAEKTIQEGMEGCVSASHCTSLSAVEPKKAMEIIKKVKDAGINIITLPSCNLHLMGRNDKVCQRRGPTRIREFLDAGVNISLASDNIRDPFRPYGNGDLLEEANLTAQLIQAGNDQDFMKVIRMITENPARAAGLGNYGLRENGPADLVIVDAANPIDALLNHSIKSLVMFKGKVVVRRELTETICLKY